MNAPEPSHRPQPGRKEEKCPRIKPPEKLGSASLTESVCLLDVRSETPLLAYSLVGQD